MFNLWRSNTTSTTNAMTSPPTDAKTETTLKFDDNNCFQMTERKKPPLPENKKAEHRLVASIANPLPPRGFWAQPNNATSLRFNEEAKALYQQLVEANALFKPCKKDPQQDTITAFP